MEKLYFKARIKNLLIYNKIHNFIKVLLTKWQLLRAN